MGIRGLSGGLEILQESHSEGGGPSVQFNYTVQPELKLSTDLELSLEWWQCECGRNQGDYQGWLKMTNGVNMSASRGFELPWDGRLFMLSGASKGRGQYTSDLWLYKAGARVEIITAFWASGAPAWYYTDHVFTAGQVFSVYVSRFPQSGADYPHLRAFFVREKP
jgi:hypothetical protein